MSPSVVPTTNPRSGGDNKSGGSITCKEESQWMMGKEAFEARMPHHHGIAALWETKWKFPCAKSLYPFHDGLYEDFEPIFKYLIENNVNDGTSPEYTNAFLAKAEELASAGDSRVRLDANTHRREAINHYLRACTLLRIARFPYITSFPEINDQAKWDAWELQKKIYRKAGELMVCPLREVEVPHVFAEGNDRDKIPVYVRTPDEHRSKNDEKPCPTVLLMTGLDGYRPDNTVRCEEFLARGWGVVIAEIPGTADCPADSADPESPDRLWSSLLTWMGQDGRFDMKRVMVWGLSSGGYYAVRIAHTHKDQLLGSVAQGAGVHFFYDKGWLEKADGHEYPFKLTPAMAMKHGFKSAEEYKEGAQKKFSLLASGILDRPSTRLLLINGTLDGLMPIEDSMLLFEHGSPKEARFFPEALHMGYPMANGSVYPWMESVMESGKNEGM
ncbi:Alpha/Beta hydrolase protein [Podospora australis]|uniref:Alpha/Beta hydrolase protein n=1 Tax=Podospora australis TaxID=1536484 RepID=A0AAN7AK46_9PEZI|nr:Alpha/Beta hydrolase protein [Podospora australis]